MSERGNHAVEARRTPFGGIGRTLGLLAAGATLLGAGGMGWRMLTSPDDQRYVSDVAHHLTDETPAEERIRTALEQTFGEKVMVRCAPMPASAAAESGQPLENVAGDTIVTSYWGMQPRPSIRFAPEVCDGMMEVADRKQPFAADSKRLLRLSALLGTAPHEAGHAHVQSSTQQYEGQANCYAAQTIETMAVALHASPAVANQLSHTYAATINELSIQTYQTNPDTCRPGGAEDLFPGLDVALKPGAFPQ